MGSKMLALVGALSIRCLMPLGCAPSSATEPLMFTDSFQKGMSRRPVIATLNVEQS